MMSVHLVKPVPFYYPSLKHHVHLSTLVISKQFSNAFTHQRVVHLMSKLRPLKSTKVLLVVMVKSSGSHKVSFTTKPAIDIQTNIGIIGILGTQT